MFRLDVLQMQWVVVMMGAGLVSVLLLVLYYLAIWRPRAGTADETAPKPPLRTWLASFLPALLVLVYVLAVTFGIVFTVAMIRHPPNW